MDNLLIISNATTTKDSKKVQTLNCELPKGVSIAKSTYGYGIFATEKFAKGTLIYLNEIIKIPNEKFDIELVTNMGTFPLNSITHSVVVF